MRLTRPSANGTNPVPAAHTGSSTDSILNPVSIAHIHALHNCPFVFGGAIFNNKETVVH